MNGCAGRSCPCDMWTQCRNYTDIRTRKWKYNHNDKHIIDINSWYRDFFRMKYECPEIYPNG